MNAQPAPHPPLLIGHRGAPAYRPEHTEASFLLALAQGADALEPDLVPTSDGVLLIRHEPALGESTDIDSRRAVFGEPRELVTPDGAMTDWFAHDWTWGQLQELRATERIPALRPENAGFDGELPLLRLRDLVALVADRRTHSGAQPRLVLELKHPTWLKAAGFDLVELLCRELDGLWESPALVGLVIESFEGTALRELRARGASAELVYLIDAEGAPADRPDQPYASDVSPAGLDEIATWADGISPSHRMLGIADEQSALDPRAGRELVAAAHDRGLDVYTWTLRAEDDFLPPALAGRPEEYWRGVLRTGVDGVFADAPDRVRAVIDEHLA